MKPCAISDLHLGYQENREALQTLKSHSDDWLVLGGDIGESLEHLEFALEVTTERFTCVL